MMFLCVSLKTAVSDVTKLVFVFSLCLLAFGLGLLILERRHRGGMQGLHHLLLQVGQTTSLYRREDKGRARRCCLRDRIYSISCRASYFAPEAK